MLGCILGLLLGSVLKLIEQKQKLCATYKHKYFTAGQDASSRIESENSKTKERGKSKLEFSKQSLLNVLRNSHSLYDRDQLFALTDIVDLIKSKKDWSEYVDKVWQSQNAIVHHIESVEVINSETGHTVYIVRDKGIVEAENSMRKQYIVKVPNVDQTDKYPVCDCFFFLNKRICCCHICFAFIYEKRELFNWNNLAPRWRLSSHPLYKKALQHLSLTEIPVDQASVANQDISVDQMPATKEDVGPETECYGLSFQRQEYNAIRYLTTQQKRYGSLSQIGNEISNVGSNSTEHIYKLCMLGLNKLKNQIHEAKVKHMTPPSLTSTAISETSSALEPVSRGATLTSEDLANKSNLGVYQKPKKQIAPKRCSDCGETGHRANSSRCGEQKARMLVNKNDSLPK